MAYLNMTANAAWRILKAVPCR